MIYGSNFTLEVEDLGIDTDGIYEQPLVIALIDTDSNYINLEPIWMFILNNKHYEHIMRNIKIIVDNKFSWFNEKKNKDDFQYFAHFHDKLVIDPIVEDTLHKFSVQHNLMNIGEYKHPDIDLIFEFEDILLYDLVLAKKKYAKVLYGDTKIKFTGLETKKTNSSKFVRNELGKFFEESLFILDKYGKTEEANFKLNKLLNNVKKKFMEYSEKDDLHYVGEPTNANTYNKSIIIDDKGFVTPMKGAHQNVKFLANYSNFIKEFDIKELPKAKQGMKIIRWAINPYNKLGIDIIGFPYGYEKQYMKYFRKHFQVDYKEQWRVKAGGIIDRFYKVIGFNDKIRENQQNKRRKFGKK